MAVNPITNPTMLDLVKRLDPNGSIANVVEILSQDNPILQDATAVEGNLPTGHRTTIRSGLPAVGWRRINDGVSPSKSRTIQVDEVCGMLEGYSEVDTELVLLNGGAAFRATEDDAFVQSMNNEAAKAIFYASTETSPEQIMGLSPRYDSLTSTQNGRNVVKHTASPSNPDQTSMWIVTWSPQTCHLIFPKGTVGGLTSEDLGKQIVRDSSGKVHTAWVTKWNWKLGLCVRDWRYVVRICDIDTSALSKTTESLITTLIAASYRLQSTGVGRQVIYCNRLVAEYLDYHALAKTNLHLTYSEVQGKPVTSFRGIPIKVCDALLNTEAIVS